MLMELSSIASHRVVHFIFIWTPQHMLDLVYTRLILHRGLLWHMVCVVAMLHVYVCYVIRPLPAELPQ